MIVYFCFGALEGGGSPGETPRRSARLSSKGRLSGDSIEGEAEAELVTSKRIKRQSRENGKDISSPKTPAKIGGEWIQLPVLRLRESVNKDVHQESKDKIVSAVGNKMGGEFVYACF